MTVLIETLKCPPVAKNSVEVVERKGLGHPDTICDILSEELSRALARYYLDKFGRVLHHNVDKALLAGGRSSPAFKGGRILQPMDIFLSGRATTDVQGKSIPVADIARDTVAGWFQRNMHAVDPASQVCIHNLVRPGSADLLELFDRPRSRDVPLANDTSCGTGEAAPVVRTVFPLR